MNLIQFFKGLFGVKSVSTAEPARKRRRYKQSVKQPRKYIDCIEQDCTNKRLVAKHRLHVAKYCEFHADLRAKEQSRRHSQARRDRLKGVTGLNPGFSGAGEI